MKKILVSTCISLLIVVGIASGQSFVFGFSKSAVFFNHPKVQAYIIAGSNNSLIFKQFKTRCDLLKAASQGKIDFYYSGITTLFLANKNKFPYVPILTALTRQGANHPDATSYSALIITSNKKIKSLKDLDHKKVVLSHPLSMSGNVLVRSILKAYGVNYTPVYVSTKEQALQVLREEKAGAAGIWDTNFKRSDENWRLLKYISHIPNPIIMENKHIQSNPVAKEIVNRLRAMHRLITQSPIVGFKDYQKNMYLPWLNKLDRMHFNMDVCN